MWSGEFEFAGGEEHHAQQQPAVAPALDVGRAVGAFLVADRHIGDLQVEFGGAKEQVEITTTCFPIVLLLQLDLSHLLWCGCAWYPDCYVRAGQRHR